MIIILIGGTGSFKTSITKTLIKKAKKRLIYDVNREYNKEFGREAIYLDFEDFLDIVESRTRNTKVVFEEATAFLSGAIGKRFSKILIGTRHTGNDYLLLFHSINAVPPRIAELAHIIFLMKTGDSEPKVKSKYPYLLEMFHRVNSGNATFTEKFPYGTAYYEMLTRI